MGEVRVRANGDVGGASSMLPGEGPCTQGGAVDGDGGWSPSLRHCTMYLNVTAILQAGRARLERAVAEVEGGAGDGGGGGSPWALRVLFSEAPGAEPVELEQMRSRRCLIYRVVDVSGLQYEGGGQWGVAGPAAADAAMSCQQRAEMDEQQGAAAQHQSPESEEEADLDLSSRSALLCGVGPLGRAPVPRQPAVPPGPGGALGSRGRVPLAAARACAPSWRRGRLACRHQAPALVPCALNDKVCQLSATVSWQACATCMAGRTGTPTCWRPSWPTGSALRCRSYTLSLPAPAPVRLELARLPLVV